MTAVEVEVAPAKEAIGQGLGDSGHCSQPLSAGTPEFLQLDKDAAGGVDDNTESDAGSSQDEGDGRGQAQDGPRTEGTEDAFQEPFWAEKGSEMIPRRVKNHQKVG